MSPNTVRADAVSIVTTFPDFSLEESKSAKAVLGTEGSYDKYVTLLENSDDSAKEQIESVMIKVLQYVFAAQLEKEASAQGQELDPASADDDSSKSKATSPSSTTSLRSPHESPQKDRTSSERLVRWGQNASQFAISALENYSSADRGWTMLGVHRDQLLAMTAWSDTCKAILSFGLDSVWASGYIMTKKGLSVIEKAKVEEAEYDVVYKSLTRNFRLDGDAA